MSFSLCFFLQSQTATFEHQHWHILLLLLMHISTQRHSHCCQAALSTVKCVHSGLVAQHMFVSINLFNDILHKIPLFRFSTFQSGALDVSRAT